ncbi:uncharacterized protein JCM15063_002859 [Sporobolomyces koalae]|uniref:uncharacterized protein n=1 Tax=Sporobolomyces koalae TaxID=500713 RepID=UPI00317ED5A3
MADPVSDSSASASLSPPLEPNSIQQRPSLGAPITGPTPNGDVPPGLDAAPEADASPDADAAADALPRPRSASGHSSIPAKSRRVTATRRQSSGDTLSPTSQPGTFLTRILGSFRPPSTSPQSRPPLPRSLSSPINLAQDVPVPSTSASSAQLNGQSTVKETRGHGGASSSTTKRFRPAFHRGRSHRSASPSVSPATSPLTSPNLPTEPPRMSPGSPATLRGKERDPMDAAVPGEHFGPNSVGGGEGSNATTPRGDTRGMSRRESVLSQRTLTAHDRTSTAGSLSGGMPLTSPLRPIEEPPQFPQVSHVDQSLQLIATLLPPALLLLSQLGPTHLFSPPLKMPSLFEVALDISSSSCKSSRSHSCSRSELMQSDRASIASTATGDTTTTAASFLPGIPSADHLKSSHSHELHAPSSLSVPAVSAAAIWRLFRGFEWIGELGKGSQPRPPSPVRDGDDDSSIVEVVEDASDEDEDEQIFDFPAMLQGVSDVLAADTAARGIELVIGQVGSGNAPSPAATPSAEEKETGSVGEGKKPVRKEIESRQLLVRADERAWSVALVWILHHIIAGASSGSTIEVRFLATAASNSPDASPGLSPTVESFSESADSAASVKTESARRWWTVSLEILHTAAPTTSAHPFHEEAAYSPGSAFHDLPSPPFGTAFAKSLFSRVGFELGETEPGSLADTTAKSWVLEGLLPSARPKPRPVEHPSTLLGRRRTSLEASIGQEPSMGDLKRFADSALKGHRVALHASDQSAFAKHLTMYLAGWGMDVQHVPLDSEGPLSSGTSSHGLDAKRPSAGSRFDSGFASTDNGSPPGFGSPNSDGSPKMPDPAMHGEPNSNLVIIDDDVSTLRRLLVSLRAPPLHAPPTLISKRPQLATRRARSSPHVRQLHQMQPQGPSQWVIIHFASLTHYKTIKEIVADALATTRSPTLPEVLVIPKPAGPRRIITALWTALKRPAVDPFLPPIATSPTSPGIQYWTPRLSPALAKDQEFDFGGSDGSGSRSGDASHSAKPRTPPTYFSPSSNIFPTTSHMPPSPLGQAQESQDSYFSSVAEELKEATPSEGMVIQSPDGRSGIFFQPQTRSQRLIHAKEKAASKPMERDRAPAETFRDHGAHELSTDASNPSNRVSTATPHEIGLGPSTQRRKSSNSSTHHSDTASPPLPLGTPALHLDSFISAAKSRANGEDVSPEELPPPGSQLSRHTSSGSLSKRPPSIGRHSNSSGGGSGPNSISHTPHAVSTNSSPNFGPTSRRGTVATPSLSGHPPPTTPLAPAAQGAAAAARALGAKVPPSPSSPRGAFSRTRTSTVSQPVKGRRRASRKNTLPSVPPIRVLIVEDNKINQTILSVFMKKRGIKCEVAVDGDQAVEKWKKGNFHLVLMDIQLPVKDGIEATREIRDLERANNVGTFITTPTADLNSPSMSNTSNPLSNPGSPLLHMPVIIVALTASSLQADRVNALAAGCNDFLTKPVSLPWLETKLVEWGSMAYLSGFSRQAEITDANLCAANEVPRPITQTASSTRFSAGISSKADEVRGHLHIDRQRADSPPDPTSSNKVSPGLQPPVNTISEPKIQPSLTLTSPTPQDTPDALKAPPPKSKKQYDEAGHTLDRVEEKLEELVQEREGQGSALHRPGPTPLPPSALEPSLSDVMAEGARIAEFNRNRVGSASFGQALIDSGVSSSRNSDGSP